MEKKTPNPWLYRTFRFVDAWMTEKGRGNLLAKGEPAPDFTALDHRGNFVNLNQFKGKKVVLWFYPKADTPGCTLEACGFRDRYPSFESKNTVVLGVSLDSVELNQKFAAKFGFPFPLLCDEDRELSLKYGACKSRQDAQASRVGYLIDEGGKIQEAFETVDAYRFPDQVLALL